MADETKKTVILKLELDVDEYTKQAVDLNKQIKSLNDEQKALRKSGQDTGLQFQQNKEKLAILNGTLRETNKVIKDVTVANKSQSGSNEQLRAQLSILTLQYNKLSEEERKTSVAGKELQANIKSISDALKANEKAVGDNRRNVGNYADSLHGLKDAGGELLKVFGVGFGIGALLEFGKESVKAFTEAEENANRLKFAITQIGGEGNSAISKLLKQSAELQDNSIFSDDDIQTAQTALVQYGLTSDQVEKLIPQILDLASAQGIDLASATDKTISAINGQTKGLKEAGISFKDTGSKTENLAILTERLNKFQGASAEALETTAGKAKRLENAFDDIKESIGELIVNQGNDVLDFFEGLSKGFDEVALKRASGMATEVFNKMNEKMLADAQKSEEAKVKIIAQTKQKIKTLSDIGIATEDAAQKKLLLLNVQSQQALLKELENIGKERKKILDDETAGAVKSNDDLDKKLREQIENQQAELIKDAQTRDKAKAALDNARAVEEITRSKASNKLKFDALLSQQETYEKAVADIEKKYQDEQDKKDSDKIKKGVADFYDAKEKQTKINKKALEDQDKANKEALEEAKADDADRVKAEREKWAAIERIAQASLQATSQLVSDIAAIENNQIQENVNAVEAKANANIDQLQRQLDAGIISQEDFEARSNRIKIDAAKEEAKLKKEQWENSKKAALIQVAIKTAQGVMTAFNAATPYEIAAYAAIALATGAAEAAVINSQPTPEFAKGGKTLSGKRITESDGKKIYRSNGDNLLATVRTNEVILNEEQQARLGGAKTFAAIGVPGFAGGGSTNDGGVFASSLSSGIDGRIAASNQALEIARSMPPSIVLVEDINGAQGNLARVERRADI